MSIDEKIKILKLMGKTYREIGESLGISKQRVEQLYHREAYNDRQRHEEHRFTANPYKNRKPCFVCNPELKLHPL